MARTEWGGGIASYAVQRQFRVIIGQVERGQITVAEVLDLARSLAPVLLAEVVAAQRLARRRYRQDNLRVLQGHLEAVAERGLRKRFEKERERFEQAVLALRTPGSTSDPHRWVQQFINVEDQVLRELARYAAHQVQHPERHNLVSLDRSAAVQILVDVAASVVEHDVETRRQRRPTSAEQLVLPFV